MSDQFILALDQGTTSSRAIVFDHAGHIRSMAQREIRQILPSPGHVEHDPEEIWTSQFDVAREALQRAGIAATQVAAIGISNQRETTILWDRATGQPVGNAIVWQSRISAPICDRLVAEGFTSDVRRKTGLVIDPYFSGTKIRYLLERDAELYRRAQRGEVLFGTVESWLIWKLTGGRRHVTDVSNASRTMLFNIHTLTWDDELLKVLGIPRAMLPEVVPNSGVIAETEPSLFGSAIPIGSAAGDQQAATFGQGCFSTGQAKNTYGTGCFLLMNTGAEPVESTHRLLTTVGWQINGQTTYCLEGAVFIAGAVVQWLRDGLGLISDSSEVEALASQVPDNGGVYLVPAFVGLGAPHWDAYASGTLIGLTRGTTAAHIARAALESMAYQTRDLLEAMQKDCGHALAELKVDGGACVNDLVMQFQADLLGVAVRRPTIRETTALGAAYLAGLAVGYWSGTDELAAQWQLDREFTPAMSSADRDRTFGRWQKAVRRSLAWNEPVE
jgi:glycerol kinase